MTAAVERESMMMLPKDLVSDETRNLVMRADLDTGQIWC